MNIDYELIDSLKIDKRILYKNFNLQNFFGVKMFIEIFRHVHTDERRHQKGHLKPFFVLIFQLRSGTFSERRLFRFWKLNYYYIYDFLSFFLTKGQNRVPKIVSYRSGTTPRTRPAIKTKSVLFMN